MKFSGINLLDELERADFEDIRNVFSERKFKKGAVIFAPDTEDDLVFIVAKGRVRIYLAYESKEFTLGILGPGDLYSTHAGCFVQAYEDGMLLTTDVQSVKRCMADIPIFNRTMVRVLGKILQNSFSVIDGLVFKDINSRLCAYLYKEADQYGKPVDGGIEINLNLTTEQLSTLLGATRQTVSTLLNNLIREGILVRIDRSDWLVSDLEQLKSFAEN
ncbi:Crp/Fnr family transcriptional regulator [Maridesulfovibrio salexigens]|uniref:Transcriptional regulator, Crp/Fnr family n=1 Tax=Maridesulfovibrio salexigens (strain ATCC 14822 / DSM 2638 / NCIMB 8403 / VKM B-1763) TaxID=526222 RepID=C6BY35_MARSD|nr:Crp/Fnr family transcriptional regulator [Maridesulfovibrio salexigens]ACS80565.1 transcriptional regulator, Crp/Fnr family [Maridesulfovibrio salexigens DSM 2638]